MTSLQRNALQRDVERRLASVDLETLRVLDRSLTRLEQLRALSWSRLAGEVDQRAHIVGLSGGSVLTRCNGRWPVGEPVQTWTDSPPIHLMCLGCVHAWARGKDVDTYGLLELARELATEDIEREALHEAARVEMIGGGT